MVETWRWPKASYSALSTSAAVDAQPRRGVAIDDHGGLQALVLLVGVDVAQFGQRAQLLQQKRGPVVQVAQVLALQRVLILRLALAAADAEVLRRLQEQGRAGHHRQFAAQPADHLVGADLALGERFQRDEHAAAVGRSVAAGRSRQWFRPPDPSSRGATNCVIFSRMAGNEMSCAACTEPMMRPVSCCGKKPLGTMTYR